MKRDNPRVGIRTYEPLVYISAGSKSMQKAAVGDPLKACIIYQGVRRMHLRKRLKFSYMELPLDSRLPRRASSTHTRVFQGILESA